MFFSSDEEKIDEGDEKQSQQAELKKPIDPDSFEKNEKDKSSINPGSHNQDFIKSALSDNKGKKNERE